MLVVGVIATYSGTRHLDFHLRPREEQNLLISIKRCIKNGVVLKSTRLDLTLLQLVNTLDKIYNDKDLFKFMAKNGIIKMRSIN